MDSITTLPQFVNVSEEEIERALDRYDDEENENALEISPLMDELERLIAAYSDRFDKILEENDDTIPTEVITFEPKHPIERVAYGIFLDALHDAAQEGDPD